MGGDGGMSIVPGGGGGGEFFLKTAAPMRPPNRPKSEYTTTEMIMLTTRTPELSIMRSTMSRTSGVISGFCDIARSTHCCWMGPITI